jgi:CHASE1-domain containing sensor protein
VVRLGFIIGFIALIGVLLSGLAAYRVHEQELAIDGIALARAIDVHASLVQDRLTERELLARVASGLFRSPSVVKANMLQPLRSAIYAFKSDFVIASWIARLKPADFAAAQAELKSAGFTNPTIRDFDDRPLDLKAIDKPLDVMMDVEPRSADMLGIPGRAFERHSVIGPMLAQAAATGKPVASDPIPMLRQNGPIGIVLASAIVKEGTTEPVGFIAFSYELAPLMLTNDDRLLFLVVLKDLDDASDEYVANEQGVVTLWPVK